MSAVKTTVPSSLGANYGEVLPIYGGIVLNVTWFPDGTYFYVENGGWLGYITTNEDGKRVMYTGVSADRKDPTEEGTYVIKIVLEEGAVYDAAIGKAFKKDTNGVRKYLDVERFVVGEVENVTTFLDSINERVSRYGDVLSMSQMAQMLEEIDVTTEEGLNAYVELHKPFVNRIAEEKAKKEIQDYFVSKLLKDFKTDSITAAWGGYKETYGIK